MVLAGGVLADREQARQRLVEALRETVILGPRTNLSYLLSILETEAFAKGEVHTSFLEDHLPKWTAADARPDEVESALLAAASALLSTSGAGTPASREGDVGSRPTVWANVGPLRLVPEGD